MHNISSCLQHEPVSNSMLKQRSLQLADRFTTTIFTISPALTPASVFSPLRLTTDIQ